MRLVPRSLAGRLVATALLATGAALLIAALAIGQVLEHFVIRGLDDRLDAQVALVSRAVRPDGSIDRSLAIDLPPFDQGGSGWAWEAIAPRDRVRSASLGNADLVLPVGKGIVPPPPPPPVRPPPGGAAPSPPPPPLPPPGLADGPGPDIRPLDGTDSAGRRVHGRMATIATAAGEARVIAVAPRSVVERPLRSAIEPLLLSLVLIAAFLLLALLVQLRFGLRPLRRLGAAVAEVRAGRRRSVDLTEPTELVPLVDELNALILANERALTRARGHVANLAHGLKTPLATLRLELAAGGESDGARLALVDRMDRQIRHHLGRARAAEGGNVQAPATALGKTVAALVEALARIHADLAVRCDPQDLDELLGNLLDNAWRHARSLVQVSAVRNGGQAEIRIADDGPGMSEADLATALAKGGRLDESEPGHGFGLAISRELAELHHGSLALLTGGEGPGGLEVRLTLPAA